MKFSFSHFNPEAIIHERETITSVSFPFGILGKEKKILIKGSPKTPLSAIRFAKKWLSKPMTKKLWKKWIITGKYEDWMVGPFDWEYYEDKCRGSLLGNHTWLDGASEDSDHCLSLWTGS